MADPLPQPYIVEKGSLYDQSPHTVRSDGDPLILAEWRLTEPRRQPQGQLLDVRVGRPEIWDIDAQTGRIADAEQILGLDAWLGEQQIHKACPRRPGVAGKSVNQNDRDLLAFVAMIDSLRLGLEERLQPFEHAIPRQTILLARQLCCGPARPTLGLGAARTPTRKPGLDRNLSAARDLASMHIISALPRQQIGMEPAAGIRRLDAPVPDASQFVRHPFRSKAVYRMNGDQMRRIEQRHLDDRRNDEGISGVVRDDCLRGELQHRIMNV